MTTMGTCPNAGCTAESPCVSCRTKALEAIASNPEAVAGLDLDGVFESAVIKGIMAITWRDDKGEPIKDAKGSIARGLPKLMAEDFWKAYGAAKREGMQKIAETIAKTFGASAGVAPQAASAPETPAASVVSSKEGPDEDADACALLKDEEEEVVAKPRSPSRAKRASKRAAAAAAAANGANGGSAIDSGDSPSSIPKAEDSSTKAAH